MEIICLSCLSFYSLLSLSINGWFHNVNDIYTETTNLSSDIRLYTHSFQASFSFDILIFVWTLFGFLISRKSIKYLCQFFAFYLLLLCLGKRISTAIFLGNDGNKSINDIYKNTYDQMKNNDQELPKALTSWKASYENMYASVILELLLGGLTGFFMVKGGISQQVQKS